MTRLQPAGQGLRWKSTLSALTYLRSLDLDRFLRPGDRERLLESRATRAERCDVSRGTNAHERKSYNAQRSPPHALAHLRRSRDLERFLSSFLLCFFCFFSLPPDRCFARSGDLERRGLLLALLVGLRPLFGAPFASQARRFCIRLSASSLGLMMGRPLWSAMSWRCQWRVAGAGAQRKRGGGKKKKRVVCGQAVAWQRTRCALPGVESLLENASASLVASALGSPRWRPRLLHLCVSRTKPALVNRT